VSVGSPIAATVNFGKSFSSIESVCFNFHFQGDLLDPGDELAFGPFEGQNTSLFGFGNNSSPLSDRGVCILGGVHAEVSFFLDGQPYGPSRSRKRARVLFHAQSERAVARFSIVELRTSRWTCGSSVQLRPAHLDERCPELRPMTAIGLNIA
jgi:hypothetical protein